MNQLRIYTYSHSGASLVEYAVALIVVTVVGGAAAIGLGSASGQLNSNAATVVISAQQASAG